MEAETTLPVRCKRTTPQVRIRKHPKSEISIVDNLLNCLSYA